MDDGYWQLGQAWDRINLLELRVERQRKTLERIAALDSCPHAQELAARELARAELGAPQPK